MSLDTYANLQTEIASWLRRTDLTSELPTFIALAETEMNRRLKTSLQLVSQTFSITGEFVAKPAGFRQMRSMRLTSGTGRLMIEVTPEQMAANKAVRTTYTAEPYEYTALGAQFEFYPVPNQTYSAVIEFQQGFAPLSASNTSNWILADHPDAYLWGALAAASAYVKNDERAQGFKAQFVQSVADIQAALRTSYDRKLRVDPGLQPLRRTFNIIAGY